MNGACSPGWRYSPEGAVFAAVESVCADDALDRVEILDLLSRLVDKSLVVAEFDESGDAAIPSCRRSGSTDANVSSLPASPTRCAIAMRSGTWR